MSVMNPYTANLIDPVAQLVDPARELPCLRACEASLPRRCEVLHCVCNMTAVTFSELGAVSTRR
jgi:hypothetical protein